MLNNKVVFIHSPTGSGKTHTINYLLNKIKITQSDFSVCCITSRRTMISTYENAINISQPNQNQTIKFDNYLKSKYSLDDYFISSLEFLPYIKRQYNVIVLDEITSLIRHYYSETMDGKRYKSFLNLIKLINEADYVICADAIFTDFIFKLFDNMSINYFYYRNDFKNCLGKNMIIYRSELYDVNSEIAKFVRLFKKDVQEKKSVLIFSDSKYITEAVFLLLQKYNNDLSYYMIINRDSTELDTITNCNQTFVNKCVIVSPKIIYGVDIQIKYDNIYCIYKNTTNMNGMSSIEYHQQINRSRQASDVHVLFLNQSKYKMSNHYIPFESFCELENKRYQEYKNEINQINNKYSPLGAHTPQRGYSSADVVDELCSTIDFSANAKIQENLFTPIHYLKSWYDETFARNKVELIEMLAKECGYSISYKKLETKNDFDKKDFKQKLETFGQEKAKEKLDIATGIVKGYNLDKISNKVLLEQLLARAKILKINNCTNIEEILANEKKFNTFINRKYLDLSLDEFNKFKSSKDKNEIGIIQKDSKLIKKIELIFWIEKLVGNKRYDIDRIQVNDVEVVKNKLMEKINELILLSDGIKSKNGLIKLYQNKINKLEDNDGIKSFIADCYNSFGEIICVKNKRVRNKETQERKYVKSYLLIN